MNEVILKEKVMIENMIYEIREKQVMLDSDLARLYEFTNGTKDINKAVSRNIERFPSDFYFQLTKEENKNLKFQIGTSSIKTHGGVRKIPYSFTEHGIMMLLGLPKNEIAVEVKVKIIDAFAAMRKYISTNLIEQKYINELVLKDSKRIDLIELTLGRV